MQVFLDYHVMHMREYRQVGRDILGTRERMEVVGVEGCRGAEPGLFDSFWFNIHNYVINLSGRVIDKQEGTWS